jgi:L-iditol 2-dehydrogenase
LADDLGANVTLRADKADVLAEVLKRTGGRGADVAMEAVGLPETFSLAAACVRKGGELTLVGNVSPTAELPLQAVVTRELTLHGSCASCGEYPACLDMIARGMLDPDPLISAVAPLAEGAEWFRRLYGGEKRLIKVILKP